MQPLVRGLLWPVISLVVVGTTHLVAELIRPELHDVVSAAVAMPIYLVAGAMAAILTIRAGGSVVLGFTAGAILGLLPVGLQVVGFGLIAGVPADAAATAAFFGWLGVFWGGSLGTALERVREAAQQ